MRIAVVSLGWRGGGGPVAYELATHLAERAEVLAVLSKYSEILPAWQETPIAKIVVPTYRSLAGAVAAWLNHIALHRLAARIRAWQPDVVLYPMFYTLNPFLQLHLRDIPAVVMVHDPEPHPGLADTAWSVLENIAIRQASRCIVLSQSLAPALVKRGARPEQIDAVAMGMFEHYRRYDTQASPGEKKILFFGRITPYKGVDVLLKAYAAVRQTHPAGLLVVGSGDVKPYLPAQGELEGVELVNRWISEAEVASYFEQAALVVLPYTSASQSGVVPLAASYGLPVIATSTGGLVEQVRDEETGLLVEPGSVEGLAAAMRRLLDQPDLARRLGENLRRDYQENKAWEAAAEGVYRACEQAIEAQAARRVKHARE